MEKQTADVYDGTRESTCETTPWHIWRHSVEVAAARMGAGSDCDLAFTGKLSLWYRSGEPVWMAAEGLVQLVRGAERARREAMDTPLSANFMALVRRAGA